jgi:hypothetical protein
MERVEAERAAAKAKPAEKAAEKPVEKPAVAEPVAALLAPPAEVREPAPKPVPAEAPEAPAAPAATVRPPAPPRPPRPAGPPDSYLDDIEAMESELTAGWESDDAPEARPEGEGGEAPSGG